MFIAAAIFFVVSSRRHPGRETVVYRDGWGPDGRIDPGTACQADDGDGDTGDTDESDTGNGKVEA